ncbi:MAG: CHASE2 domain-containing protein [Leptolyngbyaceae cyanobacterium bins.349]|nr:CHASE2 domain-containing protein [Leptolyngbyaceae cyanobacterium bins.349]
MFRLKVWHIEQTCVFELSWGKGRQLTAKLPFPSILKTHYKRWQSAYIDFYKSKEFQASTLRARVDVSGTMATPEIDWRARLAQAEAELTSEFHHWLSSAELIKIRKEIASGGQPTNNEANPLTQSIDVFLTCDSLELERLPWETWEIGTEFAASSIRLVRTPANIEAETGQRKRQGKMRILAILGDETGLNFQQEREALKDLKPLADITFIGWQKDKATDHLLEDIQQAIANPNGWDLLFFAGHSNETNVTGGELTIAPNQSVLVSEIAPQLLLAKQHGLQFAIFNSCRGLSIANSLISLGLGQVAVMREPIHNRVAQEFLIRFLRQMATYQDVQDTLRLTCQSFKLDKNLTYPSAYLVPSLFRHPDSDPFRLQPFGWKEKLKQWMPTKVEAIALAALVSLSIALPVQNWLLERRVLAQAIYRQATGQLSTTNIPPVLLVQIDEASILQDKIYPVRPISRPYLAQLINQLVKLNAQVIGIDYLLHRHQDGNEQLTQTIKNAVEKHQVAFIFASTLDQDGTWQKPLPTIANPKWSLDGDMDLLDDPVIYARLIGDTPPIKNQPQLLPLSYLLALTQQLKSHKTSRASQTLSKTAGQIDWLNQLKDDLGTTHLLNRRSVFPMRSQIHPITAISYRLNQMWLHPLIDYSIPPEQVYQSIPAYQLRLAHESQSKMKSLEQRIVIIAPGGHLDAGVLEGRDNFLIPQAMQYWHAQKVPPDVRQKWTGGEVHAYMVHNLLNHRLIIPIPALWLIGLVVLCGKGAVLFIRHRRRWYWVLFGGGVTILYGVIGFQTYITAGILLPWLLPILTLWVYILPVLLRRDHYV